MIFDKVFVTFEYRFNGIWYLKVPDSEMYLFSDNFSCLSCIFIHINYLTCLYFLFINYDYLIFLLRGYNYFGNYCRSRELRDVLHI